MEDTISVDGSATQDALVATLRRLDMVTGDVALTPLTGGVASDIWRVDHGGGVFVVKRALPKLRVAADWRAPISRNASEAAWFDVVQRIVPHCVPRILFHDVQLGLFAMTFFDPLTYPVWKSELMLGRVNVEFAAAVGQAMARIHRVTLGDVELARQFDTGATFHAIRLEPYLEEAARRHPVVCSRLMMLSRRTGGCHAALVHGDVSPKNILVGPRGPIFLDAECAWYGDPAFDLAFCLNHLLLKGVYLPPALQDLMAAFGALAAAYAGELGDTDGAAIIGRAADLLPALLLGRVDGKSPVEYLATDQQRETVRSFALQTLSAPSRGLDAIREDWMRTLSSCSKRSV